ncbi:MAG: cyclic pyranopterin monophosphate synthase MoaC [Desulfobacterales bacterium]|nr:MAG: cyclic pyranopterin monophosphate synthase MoaC [Desulfobacterales bacterium]
MSEFTHIDEQGHVRMVDVTDKKPTARVAVAAGKVAMRPATFDLIRDQKVKKGNVLETARIAGIMAAKKTSELVPMCHPLHITHVQVDFFPRASESSIGIEAAVRTIDQTGVEMEALTAVSAAALTIYDMCKAYDKEMIITDIQLLEKSGGKSGTFRRDPRPESRRTTENQDPD